MLKRIMLAATFAVAICSPLGAAHAAPAHAHRHAAVHRKHRQESKPDPIAHFARDLLASIQARDVDRVMSHYQKSEDLIAFDVTPPMEYRGWDAYRKDYQDVFTQFKSIDKAEFKELHTRSSGTMAYFAAIVHLDATGQDDKTTPLDLRLTDVLQKIGGKWLIVHEHASVPANLGGTS